MITTIRDKFGPKMIAAVIGLIAFVFIFSGVFMSGSSSSQAPSVAGEVNGEVISYGEFSRALNQRMEFMKNLMGGKITDEQMEQFHIREAVFQDLAQKKLMGQIAKKEGFYPSAEQIRDQIVKMDVFQKDGRFDKVLYKNVLAQNSYSPPRFEEIVGHDIMDQNFRSFVSSLATVNADEVEKELKSTKEKRKIKYVYLDNESARKLLPADLKPEEQGKQLDAKVESLSQEILPALSANNEGKINGLMKGTAVKVKTSDWLSSASDNINGVGSIRSIQNDLFQMKKGDPAKRFTVMGGSLYAVVADMESYNPAKVTAKERSDLTAKLESGKQSEIMQEFIKAWMKKASVSRNDKVVVGKGGSAVPVTMDN